MYVKRALIDLNEGLRYKYPLCCILHFCFDTFLGYKHESRRMFRHISGLGYVPCVLHMKAYHQTEECAKQQLVNDTGIYVL